MLVLSRKLGEVICIGDDITVTIVDIDRGKVRLGIDAPRDVVIMRRELLARGDPHHYKAQAQEEMKDAKCTQADHAQADPDIQVQ